MPTRAKTDPIIDEARRWWPKCSEGEKEQRERIVTAKKFHAGDQWPEAIKNQREGNSGLQGTSPQPPRPCLVVDRLSQPMRRISNTIKNADFGFDVLPVGDGADVETAEILKGYLRRVQNQARGESPIEWAADCAIEGGIGWFRLRTQYVHQTWDGEPTDAIFHQELVMERIANNLTVYCDPSANRPTRSDALRMFVTEDMDRTDFTRKYPNADVKALDFETTGDMATWVTKDTVRIAEYWRVTYTDRPFYWLEDGTIHEGPAPKTGVRMSRVMRVPTVQGYKINACEVLEQWDWPGSRIPLIPVIGEELNIDGKPWLRGVIEPGIGAQRMVNYTYSGAVEIYALSSKKAPMIPGAAVQPYKEIWQTRNIINHSYLPYDPWDQEGRALPQPTLDTTDAPIQASVALMQVSEESIKATTSTGDASLGNSNPNERSARALESLQSESDLANSNYPDNVRRAYIYASELMLEIIPKITQPGQILHILGMDDEPQQVIAGQPFKMGANGRPEPAPDDVTPEIAKLKDNLWKFYDLNNGTYSCTVTMGKATATRRKEGANALGELLPHLPPDMQAKIIPDYIKQLSFPGAQAIAEKLEPPTEGEPDPQQMAAQIQQLQQELQRLQPEQVKAQTTLQKTQIETQSRETIAAHQSATDLIAKREDNETKLAVAELGAKVDRLTLFLEERARLGVQQSEDMGRAHDIAMSAVGHQQGLEAGAVDHAQGLEAGAADAETQAQAAEAQRQHEATMAERSASVSAEQADADRAHQAKLAAQKPKAGKA